MATAPGDLTTWFSGFVLVFGGGGGGGLRVSEKNVKGVFCHGLSGLQGSWVF